MWANGGGAAPSSLAPVRGRSLGSIGRPRAAIPAAVAEPVTTQVPAIRVWEVGGTTASSGSGSARVHMVHGSSPTGSGRHSASPAPRGRKLPTEVEQMVAALDQRVMQVSQAEGARLRMLQDHAQRLLEGLHAMRVAREIQDERRQKELRMLDGNVTLDLHKARQERDEMCARLEERGSKVLGDLRESMRTVRQQRDAECEDYSRSISEEVYRVHGMLEEQRAARMQYGERIGASLEVEFRKVQDAILAEQKLRFEAESTMLRMVEDVCSRMRGEIQQERQQREAVQGKLLGLLEETCSRIETSFSVMSYPNEPAAF